MIGCFVSSRVVQSPEVQFRSRPLESAPLQVFERAVVDCDSKFHLLSVHCVSVGRVSLPLVLYPESSGQESRQCPLAVAQEGP